MPPIPNHLKNSASAKRNAPSKSPRPRTVTELDSVPDPNRTAGYSYLAECVVCGREYVMKNTLQRYCSTGPGSCKQKHDAERKRARREAARKSDPLYYVRCCEWCGGSFRSKRKDKKHCKPACKQAAHREFRRLFPDL